MMRVLKIGVGSQIGAGLSGYVAELTSCFVGAELGLPCDIPNHASYVSSWLRTLRQDKREIFRAAAEAQRMADYLLGFHPGHARRAAEEARRDEAAEAA